MHTTHDLQPEDVNVTRFWSYVKVGQPNACWEWQGALTKWFRQGRFRVGQRVEFAHRVAYVLTHGPIAGDLLICHECDNEPCCNPAHLFPGTHQDNAQDAIKKGRLQSKLSPQEVENMRQDYATGTFTHRALAEKYGCSYGLVGFILKNKRRCA